MASSGRIELSPCEVADVDTLLGWIPDERFLFQWAGRVFRSPLDRAQLLGHLERVAARSHEWRAYKVTLPATGAMIGYGELADVDPRHGCARLSRLLVGPESSRGSGLGAELVRRLLAIAFDELALHRVELGVYDFNASAIRCYERCGFVREGLRRENLRYGDEYWNTFIMAILRSDWHQATKGDA